LEVGSRGGGGGGNSALHMTMPRTLGPPITAGARQLWVSSDPSARGEVTPRHCLDTA
jgi:hypothetical protein